MSDNFRPIDVTPVEADIIMTVIGTSPRAHRMRGLLDQLEDLRNTAWFHATNKIDDKWDRDNAHLVSEEK